MRFLSNLPLTLLYAAFAGISYYLLAVSWKRRYKQPRILGKTKSLPKIKTRPDMEAYLRSHYSEVYPVTYMMTDRGVSLAGDALFDYIQPEGWAFLVHNPSEENICLAYIWHESGTNIDSWAIQESTLTILYNRKTGLPNRIQITTFLKNDPLSVQPLPKTNFNQLAAWLTSLPFKKIAEKKELI